MGKIVLRDGKGDLEYSVSLVFNVGNRNETLPVGNVYSIGPDSEGKHSILLEIPGKRKPLLLRGGYPWAGVRDESYRRAREWATSYAAERGKEFVDETDLDD